MMKSSTLPMSYLEKYLSAGHERNQRSDVIAYLAALDHLQTTHPKIANQIILELQEQRRCLKMIASENYSSLTTQLAMGNLLTDKYCEGYPYHRFYAGCEHVDVIEAKAVSLAQTLFGADHAYVQPHSGADANLVAFWAILTHKVQDKALESLSEKNLEKLSSQEYESIRSLFAKQKILGLSLDAGGHLTHGYRYNVSGKMFESIRFTVDPQTHLIDYDEVARLAKEHRPLILLVGYSAYPRYIDFAKMKQIADDVNAVLMVDMAHFSGLVAGKAFTGNYNPVPFADLCTTTTHKILRGPRGGLIVCNKDYKEVVDKGCPLVLGGPLPHVIAAKAVCFSEALQPDYQAYARQVISNAKALAKSLIDLGLKVLTGGTDNHLVILDLTNENITGRQAEKALKQGLITANRNMVPFDQNGPWYTSGVRLGTPALTTLGMKETQMHEIATLIHMLLKHCSVEGKAKVSVDPKVLEQVQLRIQALLSDFPLYPEIPHLEVV